ncbi:hypothetical protein ANN_15469 [Periplaneta americana]|uniref:Reverse transcriptase domain-containing protein n=1 Tax=Periplaneta americana TaxID=6978 RepID=A0ABQ8SGK9_PERAM|nr:hypothetical protein ANN_15469 [Periplaneta americana]
MTTQYGFNLSPSEEQLTVIGFADDIVIIGKDKKSALTLFNHAVQQFHEIGLDININKCKGMCIKKGQLFEENFHISSGNEIAGLQRGDFIRYLGVNFYDEINFDPLSTLSKLRTNVELLISSPHLQADLKYNIINTSICPSLIYPFQTVPPKKL